MTRLSFLIAAETLRLAGLVVIEADTAEAGAALLQASEGEIDAVFTDVETPGTMSGLDLARLVAETWPSLPVVVTSGRIVPCAEGLPERACFVGKPYDIDRVAALIVQLAEQSPAPAIAASGEAEPNVVMLTVVAQTVL